MELLRVVISRGRIGEISSPEFGLGISGVLWEAQGLVGFSAQGLFHPLFPALGFGCDGKSFLATAVFCRGTISGGATVV